MGPCKKAGVSRGRSGCSVDPLAGVLDLEHLGLEATDAGMGVGAGCTATKYIIWLPDISQISCKFC